MVPPRPSPSIKSLLNNTDESRDLSPVGHTSATDFYFNEGVNDSPADYFSNQDVAAVGEMQEEVQNGSPEEQAMTSRGSISTPTIAVGTTGMDEWEKEKNKIRNGSIAAGLRKNDVEDVPKSVTKARKKRAVPASPTQNSKRRTKRVIAAEDVGHPIKLALSTIESSKLISESGSSSGPPASDLIEDAVGCPTPRNDSLKNSSSIRDSPSSQFSHLLAVAHSSIADKPHDGIADQTMGSKVENADVQGPEQNARYQVDKAEIPLSSGTNGGANAISIDPQPQSSEDDVRPRKRPSKSYLASNSSNPENAPPVSMTPTLVAVTMSQDSSSVTLPEHAPSLSVQRDTIPSPSNPLPHSSPIRPMNKPRTALEPSIFNVEPIDEFTREVADWLWGFCSTLPNLDTVEIEAKIGILIDTSTQQRLQMPVAIETILTESAGLRFESNMTLNQHAGYNQLLNKLVHMTSNPSYPFSPVYYAHTKEVDSFHDGPRSGEKVRVTRKKENSGEISDIIRVIEKIRIADMNIFSPKRPFDWRISVSVEQPAPLPEGKSAHVRHKDRMSYSHQLFQVDLTQVTTPSMNSARGKEIMHELEIEYKDARVLFSEAKKEEEGREDSRYLEMVQCLLNNIRMLIKNADDP